MVIRLSAMGDVAMTVPVLKAVLNQNPTVKIIFLSKPFLKPLFKDIENITFYEVDVKGKHKGIIGIYKLFKELKQLKIDGVADLHNVLRSKLLCVFFKISNIKTVQIDKGRAEKMALTRIKNKIFKQLKSTHQRYADVFNKLGFPTTLENSVFLAKKPLERELLTLTGKKEINWIGIAPFAQYQSKMYPLDLMEQVIGELIKRPIKLFLFGGGKAEMEQLDKLSENFKNVINVAGKYALNEELTLISNLDCMVSMDSGNAHFSAMYGVPTITLWGITHPYAGFMPYNQSFDFAILPDLKKYPNIPCSIYGNKVCSGYNNVMRTISPNTVVAKVEEILKKIN